MCKLICVELVDGLFSVSILRMCIVKLAICSEVFQVCLWGATFILRFLFFLNPCY